MAPLPSDGPPSSNSGRASAVPDLEAPMEVHKPWARGDSIVSTGLRIAFKDLTYSVPSTVAKGEKALLLKNVSAYFEPNQMAALMGPSGSGKTTLLDLLAGRKTVGKTEGTLLFGGQKPSPAFLRRYTGYVEQFDTLLGTLTVEEMLLYTAELKRPRQEPQSSKREAVDKLIEKLALGRCRSVKIGDGMNKGISGGQAKRTNIGIALITNPRILFLDEPTSGLDSFTANEVMKVVKGLAKDGTTICATIHSPTAATFALFDRVLMLVRGEVVYFGVQGEPAISFAVTNWEAAKAALPAGGGVIANDAEWLVDIVTEADIAGQGSELARAYAESSAKKENDALLDAHLDADSAVQLSEDVRRELAVNSATATPWWWGVGVLLKYRSIRNFINPAWLGPRMADKLLVSLIILTLYLGIGNDLSGNNLVNIQSMLFMWCLLPAFGATSYVPAIVLERRLFVRERSDGLYRSYTYFFFKLAEEITLSLLLSLAFASFVFYGVQLHGEFVVFWLVYFIDLCLGIVLAYGIAAVAPNMDVANAAVPAYVVTLLFFAGQLITFSAMPDYWYWYSRIDFLRYAWSALMINQFGPEDPIFSGNQTSLEYFSLDGVDKWAQVGYLSLFFGFFATVALLALTFVKHQKR